MKMKKIGKVVLASAIALGGLGVVELTQPQHKVEAAIQGWGTTQYADLNFWDSTYWKGLPAGPGGVNYLAKGTTVYYSSYITDTTLEPTGQVAQLQVRLELHDVNTGAFVNSSSPVLNGVEIGTSLSGIVAGHTYNLYLTYFDQATGKWLACRDANGNGNYVRVIGK
jgi:hypothetical protein